MKKNQFSKLLIKCQQLANLQFLVKILEINKNLSNFFYSNFYENYKIVKSYKVILPKF